MIKFGPSGNSLSFYAEGYAHTEEAAHYVKERGLDCFEYSFGRAAAVLAIQSSGPSVRSCRM